MTDDIVTRLKVMAKYCNHGYPNGAGPMGPDPTECRSCTNIKEGVRHIEALQKAERLARQWHRIATRLYDALTDTDLSTHQRHDAVETYLNYHNPHDDD